MRQIQKRSFPQFRSGIGILICCRHLLGLETCSSSWVGRSWTCFCPCSCPFPCSRSCMTDSCGFFSGSCSFPFLHSCCGSCPSLVGFSLLCMGSCCGLCHHRRLHVPPCHHCSSRPSHGFHKAESHQVPCMRQSRPSCPPSQ